MQCEGLLPASLLVRAALVWYSAAVKAAANYAAAELRTRRPPSEGRKSSGSFHRKVRVQKTVLWIQRKWTTGADGED